MESSSEVLERAKVREVAGLFHSRQALEDAVEDLLTNGFDRADIDQLASLDEVRKRLGFHVVASEELADLTPTPRRPAFTRDDRTIVLALTASVLAGATGCAVAFWVLISGGDDWSAGILGALIGLGVGAAATLVTSRAFRRDELQGLESLQTHYGIVLWVRVHTAEHEVKAQEILRRNGGRAIRVHEIEVEKRANDLPLSSFRPDPWLGSEPLGRP